MISIIICSRTAEISLELFQNIQDTVGCEYELIIIDNSKNIYSIFEAYNIGIQKSKGDYWCFMHDDIILHTQNWGEEIHRIFEADIKIGLIGVAGAKIKTKMPSAWWHCPQQHRVVSIIQHSKGNDIIRWEMGFDRVLWKEVSIIDGVFMVGRKISQIAFDERLEGFHNYDLNLSLAYRLEGYKVIVTKSVLLEHHSVGTRDRSWYISTLHFDDLYGNFFPHQIRETMSKAELKMLEFQNGSVFCENLIRYNLKAVSLRYWARLLVRKPFAKFHLRFIKLLIKHNTFFEVIK